MVMLFDQYHLPKDIFEIIFATNQQRIVAKVLIDSMKTKKNEMNKTEMSFFATKLHDGQLITEIDEPSYRGKKVKLSYNKRQFYDRILTPMKTMGLIDYDMYKKSYRVSENFTRELSRIGLMWVREVRKPVQEFKLKRK